VAAVVGAIGWAVGVPLLRPPAGPLLASIFLANYRTTMLGILPVNLKTRIEHYGIVTRKNSTLSSLAKMFIQILRQQN